MYTQNNNQLVLARATRAKLPSEELINNLNGPETNIPRQGRLPPAPFYFVLANDPIELKKAAEGYARHVLDKELGDPYVIKLLVTPENNHIIKNRLFAGNESTNPFRPISPDYLLPGQEACLDLKGLTVEELTALEVQIGRMNMGMEFSYEAYRDFVLGKEGNVQVEANEITKR